MSGFFGAIGFQASVDGEQPPVEVRKRVEQAVRSEVVGELQSQGVTVSPERVAVTLL